MKYIINGYEVNISAKFTDGGAIKGVKVSKKETMQFMNLINILCNEAASRYEEKGHKNLYTFARRIAKDIYKTNEKGGLFD